MTLSDREQKLVEAARPLADLITHMTAQLDTHIAVTFGELRALQFALAAYSEPPNAVFSQEVPFDSRKQAAAEQ